MNSYDLFRYETWKRHVESTMFATILGQQSNDFLNKNNRMPMDDDMEVIVERASKLTEIWVRGTAR